MMSTSKFVTAICALSSVAAPVMADTFVNTIGNGDGTGLLSSHPNYAGSRAAWTAALGTPVATASNFTGGTASSSGSGHRTGTFAFESIGVTATVSTAGSPDNGGFFIGANGGLPARSTYFDAGDAAAPAASVGAIAFGNTTFRANGLRITFVPGIRAFAFNFDDVGDVGATLLVNWSDGSAMSQSLGSLKSGAQRDGFFGIIQRNVTLTSIQFFQTRDVVGGDANDGFTFYNFSAGGVLPTVQPLLVPLPPAAYAGLATLAGAGFIVRRRASRARSN
jgi:hypothetical protein